ncbi:MAG TPA: carboxypeptidase regulatory-like domain-containing protein [Pyrinomonadaceae bacterium]|nr:carboxypeptidase regulatory-like domain-containing protein [Pyrinomonadaceae bacterium]
MYRSRKFIGVLCALVLLALASTAAAAGGAIAGRVVNQKGEAVVGATVTATDSAGQKRQATTDGEGRFKIEGLAVGTYSVTAAAKGFAEAQAAGVAVADGQTAALELRLEVASIDAGSVTVTATGNRANSDPLYVNLRRQPDARFDTAVYAVNNLVLKRDAATFTLRSGEIYFLPPVEGRTVGAVFVGDGELTLTPPTDAEKKSLAIFVNGETLAEEFTQLVLRFSDKTFEELKNSPNASARPAGTQTDRARSAYRETTTLLRKRFRTNADIRALADLYSPERPGYFVAFIDGKRHSNLVFQMDPLGIPSVSPEEVMLFSYGESDGGVWTAFHLADEYRRGVAKSSEDNRLYDILKHEIDGAIRGTQLAATDRVTFRAMQRGLRVVPLNLFRSLRVSRVTDAEGRDLDFIQEDKDEDADLAVVLPQTVELGKIYTFVVHYQGGEALRDSGGGNFILIPRASWYPNNGGSQFGDRAKFEMTFRYPRGKTFIGVGAPVGPETREGDLTLAKWSSGDVELAVAGFNYGDFKKKELMDAESGYNIEFYANTEVPDEIKQMQQAIEAAERQGTETFTTLGAISTSRMADAAIDTARNSARLFNTYFGKLPYTRIAMSQQPAAGFGQAWPTLVYMPYTAFMDANQRSQMMGARTGTDEFWIYVGPHEVAHQWWGHMVGWTSYRDQWMSEGFAELSASIYVQYVYRDLGKFVAFWEEQRKLITEASPATKGIKPYTVGAVTQGFRLNNAKTAGAYRRLVYPKGAYILHMLRMMMFDAQTGDERFRRMMQDFIKTHFNKDVSTEDFKRIVEKHITPEMNIQADGKMDWFFDEWVYGTEMPSYRFDYKITGNTLSGTLTQSGVSDKFRMLVPLYVDFGDGWKRIGSATMTGNTSVEVANVQLPQAPKRAAVAALNDVLAASIVNTKR